jgi:M6 family metalloprotease-like protein
MKKRLWMSVVFSLIVMMMAVSCSPSSISTPTTPVVPEQSKPLPTSSTPSPSVSTPTPPTTMKFTDSTDDYFDKKGSSTKAEPYLDITDSEVTLQGDYYLIKIMLAAALPVKTENPAVFLFYGITIDTDCSPYTGTKWPLGQNDIGAEYQLQLQFKHDKYDAVFLDFVDKTKSRSFLDYKVDGNRIEFRLPTSILSSARFEYIIIARKYDKFGAADGFLIGDKAPDTGHYDFSTMSEQVIVNPAPSEASGGLSFKAVVIMAEFPDAKHAIDPEKNKARFFPALTHYYDEVSGGKCSITGDAVKDLVILPKQFSSYGVRANESVDQQYISKVSQIIQDIVTSVDSQIDFRAYDMILISVSGSLRGIAKTITVNTQEGTMTKWTAILPENYGTEVYAHEIGHMLGLKDLYDEKIYMAGGQADIYVGPWCLMSIVRGFFHLSAYHKLKLGWMPNEAIKVIPAGTTEYVTLQPVEKKISSGIKVAKITISPSLYYLVEFRRKISFDNALPDEGMLITYINENVSECKLSGNCFIKVMDADPTKSGMLNATFDARAGKKRVFTDDARNLAIIALSRDNDSLKICVTNSQSITEILEKQ